MDERTKTPEPPAPQLSAPARPAAKPAETAPARRNVVILADGVAPGPRGRIVRLAATDAQKLIDAESARPATADDLALAIPNFLPED
jgi:hypothetical protein